MFSCSIGFGSFFACLRLELRRLLDRNGNLVLARQLGLPRRLLHLVAAAATAAARTRLAQPDDVRVRLFGQHGRRHAVAPRRSGRQEHEQRDDDDVRGERAAQAPERSASAAARTGTGSSTGCAPSTWTDRCPADAFARTSGVWVVSAIGNGMGLVEILSRTGLDGCNCKRGASNLVACLLRTSVPAGCPRSKGRSIGCLDAAGPGANRRVAAAVGMKHAPAHRPRAARCGSRRGCRRGRSAPRKSGRRAPEIRRGASCPASPSFADRAAVPAARRPAARAATTAPIAGEVEPLARRAERLLDQRRGLGRRPSRESSATPAANPACFSAVESLLRPRDILKHADGEPSGRRLQPWACNVSRGCGCAQCESRRVECNRDESTVSTMDVAIVGAGPAGARAAYVLARARRARDDLRRVASAREAVRRRRHRPRAGARRRRASTRRRFPRRSHPLGAVHRRRRRGARRPSRSTIAASSAGSALVVASRARLRRARCSTRRSGPAPTLVASRVADVAVDADGVRRSTTADGARHRAAFVIGADGANSLVRRRVARAVPPRSAVDRDRLLRARRHERRDRHRAGRRSARLHLVVSAARPPGDRHLRAGRRRHRAPARCARGPPRGSPRPAIADGARLEPYSWPIPSLAARDFDALTLAGPRWVLVGDAAGLVDPITREGIFFALASGQWIADALLAGDAARDLCVARRATRRSPSWRARRAEGRVLPPGVHRPADARAAAERARSAR